MINNWDSGMLCTHLSVCLNPNKYVGLALEMKVAIAASVRDVCSVTMARGADLLKPLSRIVTDDNGLPLSLGLQALGFLCDGGGISFFSAWQIFKKNPLFSGIPIFFWLYLLWLTVNRYS